MGVARRLGTTAAVPLDSVPRGTVKRPAPRMIYEDIGDLAWLADRERRIRAHARRVQAELRRLARSRQTGEEALWKKS